MSTPLTKIAAYYRSCYQADFRAIHLLNFFSKKVQHPTIIEEAELLTGPLTQMPVDSVWGETADAYLDIYSKEKGLYTCAFFLLGKSKVMGKNQKICAPLLLYPTELILQDDLYYVQVDKTSPFLNPAVVEVLNRSEENSSITQEALAKHIPLGDLGFDQIFQFEKAITDLYPNVKISNLAEFPELIRADQLKKQLNKLQTGFEIVSAVGVGIVDKGKGARGVLNELEFLSNSADWSTPLQTLFSQEEKIAPRTEYQIIWAPATFSKAQKQVVQNAYRFPLSLVIGPPGTGKTFTIASLAVDLMSKGQSVLIASRNDQAVKVVAEKIEADLGLPEIVVKATSGNYRRAVKKRLQGWYKGFGWIDYTAADVEVARQEVLQRDGWIKQQQNKVLAWENRAMQWGDTLSKEDSGFFFKLKKWYIQRKLRNTEPFWNAVFKLEKLIELRHKFLSEYLKISYFHRLKLVLKSNRWVIRKLIEALSAKTGNKKENIFDDMDFSVMLQCMPIWITNTSEVSQMLPAYTELFDVVIIDEASQCDIASALPLLQRAKRAVIVGDAKQLKHLSFVSTRQQALFRKQFEVESVPGFWLDYRNQSLLDLVSDQLPSQEQVQLLDEHFRSLPDIIAFSNRHFYQNQLRVMTATPTTIVEKNIHIHVTKGSRSEQGHNFKEAEAVLQKILLIVEAEEALDARLCQSIGILSPFRAQVEYLQAAIVQQFSTMQILRHRMLIGTPFAFQGEERDIMLLSFAVHPESPGGVWNYLNREDVFNVSITRARAKQFLFISGQPKDYPEGNMLRAYLDFTLLKQQSVESSAKIEVPFFDGFLEEMIECLQDWGIETIHTNYSIGGLEIDLVAVHNGKTFCIDLIGYPGPLNSFLPQEHWQILGRVGLPIFALPYINWQLQPEETRLALKNYLFALQ